MHSSTQSSMLTPLTACCLLACLLACLLVCLLACLLACLLCVFQHQVSGLVAVGTSVTITPLDSGEIICFANDANSLYTDNSGSLTVTVTRLNWPNASAAEPKYIPYFAEAPTLGL
jgi:hypothetical protein